MNDAKVNIDNLVESLIRRKSEIETELSNIEVEIRVAESKIKSLEEELVKLDPNLENILNDPDELEKYKESLRTQIEEIAKELAGNDNETTF